MKLIFSINLENIPNDYSSLHLGRESGCCHISGQVRWLWTGNKFRKGARVGNLKVSWYIYIYLYIHTCLYIPMHLYMYIYLENNVNTSQVKLYFRFNWKTLPIFVVWVYNQWSTYREHILFCQSNCPPQIYKIIYSSSTTTRFYVCHPFRPSSHRIT